MKTRFRLKSNKEKMGVIISEVTVTNAVDSDAKLEFSAMVDTGSTFLTLPKSWKDKLGDLLFAEEVELEMASGEVVDGELYGGVKVKIDNFRKIYGEILFIDMEADENGKFEPLIGYLPLEAIPVSVDMGNHRLVKSKALLK